MVMYHWCWIVSSPFFLKHHYWCGFIWQGVLLTSRQSALVWNKLMIIRILGWAGVHSCSSQLNIEHLASSLRFFRFNYNSNRVRSIVCASIWLVILHISNCGEESEGMHFIKDCSVASWFKLKLYNLRSQALKVGNKICRAKLTQFSYPYIIVSKHQNDNMGAKEA